MKYNGHWPLIVKVHPDNHVLHTFLSCNLSFPSLSPVNSPITPTNNGPVLMDYTFGPADRNNFKATPDVGCSKTIIPTVNIIAYNSSFQCCKDIDNYLDAYHLTP